MLTTRPTSSELKYSMSTEADDTENDIVLFQGEREKQGNKLDVHELQLA
jgi:hypothetical protein